LALGASPLESEADAVLVIGDRAIRSPSQGFCDAWDLGEEWSRDTRLPFVFAAWMARPGVDAGVLEPALEAARDAGLQDLQAIADEQSALMQLPRGLVLSYLRDNLHFTLEARERRGLSLYLQQAAELGLIPRDFQLRFDDCRTER
jgi:chorismate dehydratase